ncbi:hypothetical protein A2625_00740 [candidate division WOR-1 bacterium RIFCSPHIGHO2_01_FULL_53_15]|uniref:Uncharacterized protein n=1 Tax=candidate division WOR-1 bacterium RIFCSPHIGHO2_01_FULL_53_15 TaxID=1802564 RepID=A0A1F4Q3C6_UNCSA|nr:MAG: hypothetical protein A2625_00740 [candidate division WOR-1 bacterium RIFCSPHIGHO2_01_FULL_53_15]OGC12691.1 MAG: hypothetical protein A3D23_03005 [candidate division WOR-1 bacterium RIFCSPHIGHO2_02_FULL_53_26]
MVPTKLVEKIAKDFDLTGNELIKESLASELRRRIAAYKFTDYLLAKKYRMTLTDFEKKKIIKKKSHSFEVEEDYHNWDQAIDGIKTIERDLKLLESSK